MQTTLNGEITFCPNPIQEIAATSLSDQPQREVRSYRTSSTDRREFGYLGQFCLPVISRPATMRLGIPAFRDDALSIVGTHRAMAVFCLRGEK